jgi:hypothetical protein
MDHFRIKNEHPAWCGPVAIALLTGCSVNDAAQLYANVHNHWRKPARRQYLMTSTTVSGVFDGETKWVLDLLGYDIFPIELSHGVSVQKFVLVGDIYIASHKILIAVPQHYVVSYHRQISDNHRQNVPAHLHPMADKIVRHAWRIKQKPYGGSHELCAIA